MKEQNLFIPIQKENVSGLVGVGEILIKHGLEHYDRFKAIWSEKQCPPKLVVEGTIDEVRVVLRRPEDLSIEEQFNLVISIIHFDNASELYLKAFLLQNDFIINLPKKRGLKFTGGLKAIFSKKTLDFTDALGLSKKLVSDTKRNEFLDGFEKMHEQRNELYHVGGMGTPFEITSDTFKCFIKSLKILFECANWYQNENSKSTMNTWEKSFNEEWTP